VRYETPTEIVEREQERIGAGLKYALAGIGVGLVALGVGFLGAWVSSRPIQLFGFGLGVVSVGLMVGAFVRTAWGVIAGVLRQK